MLAQDGGGKWVGLGAVTVQVLTQGISSEIKQLYTLTMVVAILIYTSDEMTYYCTYGLYQCQSLGLILNCNYIK